MDKAKKISFYNIKYFYFLIALYIYLYNPPLAILPFTPKYFLYSIIPIVLIMKSKLFYSYLNNIKYIFILFCFIIIYSLFREVIQSEIVFFYLQISMLIETTILPICMIIIYKQIKPDGDLLNEIILLGTIASLFTLGLILNPALDDFVKYNLLRTTEYTEFVAKRTFGFAEGLTFSYGTVQGLILAIILLRIGKNSAYYFLVPLFFISILFNSRTGFTPVVVALFLSLIINFNVKKIMIFTVIFFTFYYVYNSTDLVYEYKQTIEWGLDFFIQSSDFLSNKSNESNTLTTLFNDMAIFPNSTTEWIFGTGENLFVNINHSSDVGYIIQLYYGGLFYVLLIFLIVSRIILNIKKITPSYKTLFIVLIVCILLFNIKGNLFSPSGILRTIMLVYIYLIISKLYPVIGMKLQEN